MKPLLTCLLFAFAATAAVNWPALPAGIRLPDVLFIVLAVITMAVARQWPRPSGLDLLVVAYLAGSLPSFFATTDARASGLEFVRQLYLAAVYAIVAVAAYAGHLRAIVLGLGIGAIALSSVGLLFAAIYQVYPLDAPAIGEVMNLPYFGPSLRLRALTMTPAMLACLLAAAAPFVVVNVLSASDRGSRRLWIAGGCVVAAALMFTLSHAVAGFAVAVVIAAWPSLQPHKALRRSLAAATVLLVVFVNVAAAAAVRTIEMGRDTVADATVYPYGMDRREVEIAGTRIEYEVMSYLRIKQVAFEAFRSHPWTGVGLDRFHQVTDAAFREGKLTAIYRLIDPHSTLPGRLAETGVLGGLTLVVLWAGFLTTGVRLMRHGAEHEWLARATTAAVAGLCVNSLNVDIMNFRFLWIELGLLRGLAELNRGS